MHLLLIAISIYTIITGATDENTIFIVGGIAILITSLISTIGLFTLEPNEAVVMIFFGKYKGTFNKHGFFWVNPFMSRKRLAMRASNLDAKPIKVNDKEGNPILIGMVIVWKLNDTYKAMFEIDAQNMLAV